MGVRQVNIESRAEVRAFARLERALHGADPQYIPDIEIDVVRRLRGRAALTAGVDHALFTDADGGARASSWIHPRWQDSHGRPQTGFVGDVALAPDAEEAGKQVLQAAESWLADRGMTEALAPVDGTPMMGVGAMSSRYDGDPVFPLRWQPPRVRDLLRQSGWEVFCPHHHYDVDLTTERYRERSRRALAETPCTVRPIDKKHWRRELERIRGTFNEGFAGQWEFQDFTAAEFFQVWGQLKPIADPHMILIAELDGEPAGVCISLPDWTPLWRSFDGRMGPVQLLRLLLKARRYDAIGILAICVRPRTRGNGVGAALAASAFGWYEERGLKAGHYYLVDDDNVRSRGLVESFGGTSHVRYESFRKALD